MLPYFKSLISCQQLCYCLQGMVRQGKEWEEEENEGGEYRMQALHKLEAKDESKDSSSNYSPVLLELFRNIHEDSSVLQLKFKERSCCYIDHFRQFWTWRKSKLWSNEWWARGKSNIHTDFSRSPTVFVPTKRAKVKVNPKLKRQNWNLPDWEDIDCDRSQVERRVGPNKQSWELIKSLVNQPALTQLLE